MAVDVDVFAGPRVGVEVRVGADVFAGVKASVGVDGIVNVRMIAGVDVPVEVGVNAGPKICPGPQAENNKLEKRNKVFKIICFIFMVPGTIAEAPAGDSIQPPKDARVLRVGN